MRKIKRAWLGATCAALVALAAAAPASGAFDDPLFVFIPAPPPPQAGQPPPPLVPPVYGYFNGPCGLAVDSTGRFYVSDYYHHAVDVFVPPPSPFITPPFYVTQLNGLDPLDGPCGLAFDGSNNLYLNDYHRAVARFSPSPAFTPGPVFDSATEHPSGVAVDPASGDVYVNERTYIAVFDSTGAPLMDGIEPLHIGSGSLGNGYGLALSAFPGTLGRLYVPDASDNTVKVYDPAIDTADPIATITTPEGFVSLRDSAIAVDRVSGEIYVIDNVQPLHTEEPQATVHVFDHTGAYEGNLKYNIVDAGPPGLAVDNSTGTGQGRVYVTSGNTDQAGVYAYPSGAATKNAPLSPSIPLGLRVRGTGEGSITSEMAGIDCSTLCEAQVRAAATVPLSASPEQGSTFVGWSGGGCAGTRTCTVEMSEARSVSAEFAAPGPPFPSSADTPSPPLPTAAAMPLAGASSAAQKGALRVTVDGKLSPHRLPRSGVAPIAVSVGWKVATTDGSMPPKLTRLQLEINRHGHFDYTGLPVCKVDKIQPASSARALTACRSALVGKGTFAATIALSGQEPYSANGRLLVFNGKSHGKTVLLGQIYSPHPFPTSFVIPFVVDKLGHGIYGTALDATLPEALANWGNLTGIEMRLSRRFSFGGQSHSYISAGCPAPKGFPGAVFPLARTSFAFEGGKRLNSVFSGTCKVRG